MARCNVTASIELRRVGQNRAEPDREQGAILMPQFRQNAIVPKQIGDSGPRTSSHVTDDGGNSDPARSFGAVLPQGP